MVPRAGDSPPCIGYRLALARPHGQSTKASAPTSSSFGLAAMCRGSQATDTGAGQERQPLPERGLLEGGRQREGADVGAVQAAAGHESPALTGRRHDGDAGEEGPCAGEDRAGDDAEIDGKSEQKIAWR